MKTILCVALLVALEIVVAASVANTIEGQVYDPQHRPVGNVPVELINDVDSVIRRTKTSASGRFTFTGVPAGRLKVRVLPLGTDLQEHTQEIYVAATRVTSDIEYVQINLRYDDRRRGKEQGGLRPGVFFVQDVPESARSAFQKGVADFEKDPAKGIAQTETAIKLFPDYFDALYWLGNVFNSQKDYRRAYPYLLRAIDINRRSPEAFYSLAYAFFQLKEYPAALKAGEATTLLAPTSVESHLLYGTILRIDGRFDEAEKVLLNANSLAKEKNAEVHWQLSLLYNRLNKTQQTITELELYLKLEPDTPDRKKILDMIEKLRKVATREKG